MWFPWFIKNTNKLKTTKILSLVTILSPAWFISWIRTFRVTAMTPASEVYSVTNGSHRLSSSMWAAPGKKWGKHFPSGFHSYLLTHLRLRKLGFYSRALGDCAPVFTELVPPKAMSTLGPVDVMPSSNIQTCSSSHQISVLKIANRLTMVHGLATLHMYPGGSGGFVIRVITLCCYSPLPHATMATLLYLAC